ncbi:MAG: hypothetical protein ACJAXM_001655 [Arenicella sp.]|jgi:hypothetical protein
MGVLLISSLGLAQFRTGQRHKACVGVVEGKTRDNLFLPTRLVTI